MPLPPETLRATFYVSKGILLKGSMGGMMDKFQEGASVEFG